ncbi:helix-turn-helix domain-containing protein [Planococcus dechangensis]
MFHKNLKRLRTNKKLSQEEMATYLGITRQGYSKYENDKSEPSFEMLMKIANFFNVTIDQLIGYESTINTEPKDGKENISLSRVGLSKEDYDSLSTYQQTVLDWVTSKEDFSFYESPEELIDMIEQFELMYERMRKKE